MVKQTLWLTFNLCVNNYVTNCISFILLRLVFPSRTNFKSFHYFLLKFLVETILDKLSAKIHFSGAQEIREFLKKSQMI